MAILPSVGNSTGAWDNDTDIDKATIGSCATAFSMGGTPIDKALTAQYAAA